MKIWKQIFDLIIPAIFFLLSGCQKEEVAVPTKKVNICPEIAMNNFEEAAFMINEYIKGQPLEDKKNIPSLVFNYIESCECVDTIIISSSNNITHPSVFEFSVRFYNNGDAIGKLLNMYLYNNSKIEIHQFRN
jgi:hypothetical protein